MLLDIKNLRVRRLGQIVLDIPQLSLNQGEVLVVIGPNGAGKTTLLMTLCRLVKPETGQIAFNNTLITEIDELAYRRRISMVMQDSLLLNMSVFDNVAVGLRFRQLPKKEVVRRADEWLERFGISSLRHRPAVQLSGGEAQRVSLARAFATQPELLLLDEPFSPLDAPTRARLLEDFQSILTATNVSAVFVTHDQDEALILADKVAVLLNGHLRQVGAPQEVFANPVDPEVATFVGIETVIEGNILSNQDGRVVVNVNGSFLEAVRNLEVGRKVLFCLRPEDVTLWHYNSAPISSARNRLSGQIVRFTSQGPLVNVTIDCGFPLKALITRASSQEMELKEGEMVTATFKASAVHLIAR